MRGDARGREDIAIVGGGLAGSALAAALAVSGVRRYSVAVVQRPESGAAAADPRGIALSRSSCALLRRLGLSETLAEWACPLERVHVSQAGGGSVTLDCDEVAWDMLGCVIEYPQLLDALRCRARQTARWISADCVGAEFAERQLRLQLRREAGRGGLADASDAGPGDEAAGPDALDASLLIVADGQRSSMRERLGIAVRERDTSRAALVATLSMSAGGLAHTAYERLLSTGGIVAALPLRPGPDGARVKLIWTHQRAAVAELAELSEQRLLDRIHAAIGDLIGPFDGLLGHAVYPLRDALAEEWTRSRMAMLGNAAHTVPPLGAQGLNLTLRDVAALADTLGNLPAARDPGGLATLQGYERARRRDHAWVAGLSGGLAELAQAGPLRAGVARLGIQALRRWPALRARFIQESAGVGRMGGWTRPVP